MSTFNNNGVTMKGAVIIASLVAGSTLTFTRIAVGDGILPAGQTVLTTEKLVNPLFDVPISSVESDSVAHATVKGVFNNKDLNTGFYYRELGLFAINPVTNAEELFCYGNAGDLAEWINPAGESSLVEKEIHLVTLIGNASNVTAIFDEKATVLKSEYDAAMKLKADLDDTPENGGRVLAEQMRFDESQTLYVNAAAANGGDGTQAKPFKTIMEAINARYLGAAVIYINIKPGTYPEKINVPRSPGTTWRFVREGTGVVSIQGALIDNCNYLVMEGLTFDVPAGGDNYGVNFTNVSNASLTDVTINGRNDKVGLSFQNSRGRIVRTVINNSSIALAVNDSSVVYAYETSGTGNTIGLQSTAAIIITAAQTIQAETLYVRLVNGVINPASWQYISDSTTDVTTLPTGIYTIRNGRAEQGLPANYDGTLIVDDLTGHKHLMFFYDAQSKIFHRIMKSDGTGWNDWEDYIPEISTATPATFGLLRTTSVEDEQNCQCNDAAVTPESLYKLSDYRRAGVSYSVGAIVACPYHVEFLLKCTQAGRTADEALDTTGATSGQVIEDGGVKWEVIAKAIIDASISGKNITLKFADGTTKTLTTQDTNTDNISASSLATNGYIKFNNGLILQWGQVAPGKKSITVTFPTPFASACYSVTLSSGIVGESDEDGYTNVSAPIGLTKTTVTFSIRSTHTTLWMAIGN